MAKTNVIIARAPIFTDFCYFIYQKSVKMGASKNCSRNDVKCIYGPYIHWLDDGEIFLY